MTDTVKLGDVSLVDSMEVVASMATVAVTVAAVAAIALILISGIVYCCCKHFRRSNNSCEDESWCFERRERYPLLLNRRGRDHIRYGLTRTLGSSGMSLSRKCGSNHKASSSQWDSNHKASSSKWDSNSRCGFGSRSEHNCDVSKKYGPSKYPPPPISMPVIAASVTATTVTSTSVTAFKPVSMSTFRPRPAPIIYDSCDSSYGSISFPRDSNGKSNKSPTSSPEVPYVYIPPFPDDLDKLTMSFPKLRITDDRRPSSASPIVSCQSEESLKKKTGNVESPVQRWFFMKKSSAANVKVDSVDAKPRESSAAGFGKNTDLKPISLPRTVARGGMGDMKARLDFLNQQMVNASKKTQKRKYIYPDPNDLRNHISH